MKRIWTAVALLLIISILGGIGIAVVHRQTDTLTDTIGQAQDAALNGEIQKAIEISQNSYHYFENISTAEEYHSSHQAELKRRVFPYFSLMIIFNEQTRKDDSAK